LSHERREHSHELASFFQELGGPERVGGAVARVRFYDAVGRFFDDLLEAVVLIPQLLREGPPARQLDAPIL